MLVSELRDMVKYPWFSVEIEGKSIIDIKGTKVFLGNNELTDEIMFGYEIIEELQDAESGWELQIIT